MNRQTHPKRKGDIPVTSAGLDEFELGLLSVARHFIISFAAPDTQSWTIALNIASERWGISEGARAAVSLLAVIEAMRRARRSMFHFSDPNCPTCRETLTPNERHLMLMIHAIRQGQIGQAQTRLRKRLFYAMIQPFSMGACGDFGDDTAKGGMQGHLTFDDRGQDMTVRTDKRRRRIIAAAFQAKKGKWCGHKPPIARRAIRR